MKNIIIILILLPITIFSQNNFTHNYLTNEVINNKRWESDIKIFIYGNYTNKNRVTIDETIKYFNSLLETIQISVVEDKDSSNTQIYFLTDNEYHNLFPYSDHSLNIGATYNKKSLYSDNVYIGAKIHIDSYENELFDSFEYVIKHEMFHMLGFNHHKNEGESIINHSKEFSKKDEEMIRYLYSKDFKF
jgi:hypothetical protein